MSGRGVNSGGEVMFHCDETVDFNTVSGALFIVIFIFSVIGNILLLCVVFIYERWRKYTSVFVVNLACSDLVFTVTLPFWAVYHLHDWIFGDFACKFMTALYFIGFYSSVILLTAMTVDCFMMVVWPVYYIGVRKRYAKAACAAAWVISIAACVSDAIKVRVETDWFGFSMCEDPSDISDIILGYYLQVSLLFFLPFAIIVFCYSAIIKKPWHLFSSVRKMTVVWMLCMVTAFFICWGPYNILLIIQSVYEPVGCYAIERLYIANSVCRLLAFSHCCMNPLLLCMLSPNLRGHLLRLLHCKNAMRINRKRHTGQSPSDNQNVAFIAQNSAVLLEPPAK